MKDAPMVDVQLAEKVFWTYRTTSDVFPTPWLPRMTTFASSSEVYIWLISFLVCDRLALVGVVDEAFTSSWI